MLARAKWYRSIPYRTYHAVLGVRVVKLDTRGYGGGGGGRGVESKG